MLTPEIWYAIVGAGVLMAGAIAYSASQASQRKKVMAEFREAQLRSHGDFKKAYDDAREKLGAHWCVIEVIHDWSEYNLGPAGLPAGITSEQAFDIVRQIRAARGEAIAMILHTTGGFSRPTEMIAQALAQHKGPKVAFVPYIAMSGGTVIALATEEVCMGSTAVLGPIDTQYAFWPADAWAHLKTSKAPDRISDDYLMMSFLVEKLEKDAVIRASRLIHRNHGTDVAHRLIKDSRHHGEAISADDAKGMHIRVRRECPREIYTLVDARLGMLSRERERLARKGLGALGAESTSTSADTAMSSAQTLRAVRDGLAAEPPETMP